MPADFEKAVLLSGRQVGTADSRKLRGGTWGPWAPPGPGRPRLLIRKDAGHSWVLDSWLAHAFYRSSFDFTTEGI